MTKEQQTDEFLKAAGAVGALVPRFASAAIGISFLAYFAGWRMANGYFTTLGASWAVSLFPTSYFLYLSSGLVIPFVLLSGLLLRAIDAGKISMKVLDWCSSLPFFLAGILISLATFLPTSTATPKVANGLSTLAALCYMIALVAMIGELVYRLKESELTWKMSHAALIYIAAFYGLYMLPDMAGSAKAKYHLATLEVTLPSVRLVTQSADENWRLVEAIGDSALLMDRQMATTQPLFRIVKTTDIQSINAIGIK